jgi:hypothetical protein
MPCALSVAMRRSSATRLRCGLLESDTLWITLRSWRSREESAPGPNRDGTMWPRSTSASRRLSRSQPVAPSHVPRRQGVGPMGASPIALEELEEAGGHGLMAGSTRARRAETPPWRNTFTPSSRGARKKSASSSRRLKSRRGSGHRPHKTPARASRFRRRCRARDQYRIPRSR